LVAVTRERRYGPSQLRVDDDDDDCYIAENGKTKIPDIGLAILHVCLI